jgi:hypothetical protein
MVRTYRLKNILRVDRISAETDIDTDSENSSDSATDGKDDWMLSDDDEPRDEIPQIDNIETDLGNFERPSAAPMIDDFKLPIRRSERLMEPEQESRSTSPPETARGREAEGRYITAR